MPDRKSTRDRRSTRNILKREERREWKREKWDHKPRKLLDLVTAGTGLIKWIVIGAGVLYGLRWSGMDLSMLFDWTKK